MRFPYRQKTNNASKEARIADNENMKDIESDIREVGKRIDNVVVNASSKEVQANDARMDAEGVVYKSLKARIDADAQKEISASRLKTTNDVDKIKQIHLSEEVKQMMAGTTPINAVPADGTVTPSKLSFPAVSGTKSKNLFDKNSTYTNKYISWTNGSMIDSPSQLYVASDWIPVKANTSHSFTTVYQSAWYDSNKTYISGFNPSNVDYVAVSPANAVFVRVSVLKTNVPTMQVEEGTAKTAYTAFGALVKAENLGLSIVEEKNLGPVLTDKVKAGARKTTAQFLRDELEHPSKPVKIKILGSSSVAGNGGTGYSPTGEQIGATNYKANEAGYCWVNQLKKYIEATYNKAANEVGIDNRFFKIEGEGSEASGSSRFSSADTTRLKMIRRLFGMNTKITIPFYGDSFSMYYTKGSSVYNMSLSFDNGAVVDTITATDPVTSYSNLYTKSGLGAGYHELVITPIQNGIDATTGRMIIESVVFNKKAIVKNWAVSGTYTSWLLSNMSSLIEVDDTIVWSQMGVNDRSTLPIEGLKELHRYFIEYVKGLGKEIIISSSQPVRNESDAAATYFKLIDMDTAFRDLSRVNSVYFVSGYDPFIRYLQNNPGVSITTITKDALHPNDTGYQILFEGYMRQLEMPVLKREDTTFG
ncbi:SGNH/GDSL hydrolase family protein [Priestia megaterium]|uniref:SGNH/GDSL hydrolase family protein n=1 Tax=Priestia megaterium TaxID=1404 RepID=UPI00366F8712